MTPALQTVPLADLLAEVNRRRRAITTELDRINGSLMVNAIPEANEYIIAACNAWGITFDSIMSKVRTARVSEARMVVMTKLRGLGYSLQSVADVFKKDHGTVMHAIKTVAERANADAEFTARLEAFQREIEKN
jgi:chromosomal replication initiation ATPase DnaA